MSSCICYVCDQSMNTLFDAPYEYRENEDYHVCNECRIYGDPEFFCRFCSKVDKELMYCKVTDQFYHLRCAI